MLCSILVPIDGSPFSEKALPMAVRLAARDGGRVDLVMVTEPALPLGRVHGAPVFDPRLDEELRHEKTAYLTALSSRIQRDESVRTTATLHEGPVAATLADRAAEGDVDLVVMTTHGRGGISRAWLGSVADALVRRVEKPVLLVRPAQRGESASPAQFPRRVLIPLDGSKAAESILDAAVAVGGSAGVTYVLVRVTGAAAALRRTAEIVGFERDEAAELEALASDYLAEIAGRLRANALQVETQVLHGLDLARAILHYTGECGADLVAMSTHGRGGAARLVVGSVADAVVRGSTIPVLLRRAVPTPAAEPVAPQGAGERDTPVRKR